MSQTKKSRVVRKRSLKISCAMSKSLPSSPSPDKKVVHFADAEGRELVYVKTYVPSYDDLDALRKVFLKNSPFIDNKNDDENGDNHHRPFSKLKGSSHKLKRFNVTHISQLNINYLSACFDDLNIDEIKERLECQHVVLKNIEFDGRTVKGYIIVNNLAYEKQISVRYTFDNWETVLEVPAVYVPCVNEEQMPSLDKFMFSIDMPGSAKSMLFALRYQVDGKEYWDNNNNNNYKITDFG